MSATVIEKLGKLKRVCKLQGDAWGWTEVEDADCGNG